MVNFIFNKKGVVKNKNSGITLIALVITIIVLLILAGISISMLSGNNSILTRASDVAIETERGEVKEEINLAIEDATLKYYSEGLNSIKDAYSQELFERNIRGTISDFKITDSYVKGVITKSSGRQYKFLVNLNNGKFNVAQYNGNEEALNINCSIVYEIIDMEWGPSSEGPFLKVALNNEITESTIINVKFNGDNLIEYSRGQDYIYFRITDAGDYEIKVDYEGEETIRNVKAIPLKYSMDLKEGRKFKIELEEINEDINLKSSDTSVAKIENDTINALAVGTTTISIESQDTNIVSNEMQLNVISPVGDFVNYNVTYTDMNTDYDFNANNGWRILKKTKNSLDSTKYDLQLISTGIPANIKPSYKNNIGNENNGWWGKTEQVREIYGDFIANEGFEYNATTARITGYPNHYVVTGLRKNFDDIPLLSGDTPTDNKACYKKINNHTNENLEGSIFKEAGTIKDKIESIYNLNVIEATGINYITYSGSENITKEIATGLISLNNLYYINRDFGYDISTRVKEYILASVPNSQGNIIYSIDNRSLNLAVNPSGSVRGLRPVVNLKNVDMTFNNESEIWNIE